MMKSIPPIATLLVLTACNIPTGLYAEARVEVSADSSVYTELQDGEAVALIVGVGQLQPTVRAVACKADDRIRVFNCPAPSSDGSLPTCGPWQEPSDGQPLLGYLEYGSDSGFAVCPDVQVEAQVWTLSRDAVADVDQQFLDTCGEPPSSDLPFLGATSEHVASLPPTTLTEDEKGCFYSLSGVGTPRQDVPLVSLTIAPE
jgi:hypothetical protein